MVESVRTAYRKAFPSEDRLEQFIENGGWKARKNGRNDYPVRTMLNLIYAMKIFGHRSVESFRRDTEETQRIVITQEYTKLQVSLKDI